MSHIISCWKRGRADMHRTTSNSLPLFAVVLLWSVASYVSAAKAGLRFDDASGACPAGFERGCADGNRCYKLVKSLVDWDAARSGCLALNSDLAVIRDSEEQTCISDFVSRSLSRHNKAPNHIWIGLRKDGEGSSWNWVNDGVSTDFVSWWSGK